MTLHVLLADPPRPGLALSALPDTSPLGAGEAAELYTAMLKDTIAAVEGSGGDLLVNYPPADDPAEGASLDANDGDATPDAGPGDDADEPSPRAELRALVGEVTGDPDVARFEVQVGSTFEARAGNAAAFLLREEEADSVAVIDGTAPTLGRVDLDGAAMKLRRSEVVIGPAPGGRVAYLGLSAPIDFDGAYDPPAVEALASRGVDAGLGVDFLPMHPPVETGADLATLLATIRARETAGRRVPEHTAGALSSLGLRFESTADGTPGVVR